ncbi:MAG: hypothetical protein KAI86_15700, partial [Desulfobacterales bacterium]|nr:hypothetical protein [Desulfobacterales bacterium]
NFGIATVVKSLITKLFRKKNLPEDTVEIGVRADDNEDEILDLVDSLEEDSFTPNDTVSGEEEPVGALSEEPSDEKTEKGLETDGEVIDELEDTLDEELIEGDDWRSPQAPVSENMTDQNLEEALLELFESSDLIASELIEEGQKTGEKNEEHFSADSDRLHDNPADLEIAADSTREKDTTGKRPEPEDAIPENLFVDIKLGKGALDEKAFTVEPAAPRRESEMTPDGIHWISNDQYYPVAVQTIDRKVARFEQEIEKLIAEKEELKKKYEHVRSILYLKDEELKEAVAEIFTKYWSLKITYMDKRKRAGFGENILIKYSGRDILVKIKGTYNDYPSHKFITQVWQDMHYSGLGTSAEGALIVNYDLEKNPKDRNSAYIDEDEDQLEDLIFIDTRVLHKVTTAIIDNDLSPEKAKEILFKNGRVEFYSADLAY